jgi:CTP synthase
MNAANLILIVEDNVDHAETLKRTIERLIPDVTVLKRTGDFAKALDDIYPYRPDVFIIDLYEGEYVPEALKGPELCQQIWNKRFRPLIIHSAFDADPHIDHRLALHPFYKYISKGPADCADQVAAQVKDFLIHAAALRQVEDEVHTVLQTVIQDTAEAIWAIGGEAKAHSQALIRSARRRVGAMMDLKPLFSDEPLLSWEQYIMPPLEADLLMADVLRLKDVASTDATAYRIVLTPSCDLVRHNGKAKVNAILVGKCVGAQTFFEAAQLRKQDGAEVLKKQLATMLTHAQINGYCPLPAYPGLWPDMAVKLRDTEFVGFDNVVGETAKRQFLRVASIDSPFREQIAWAHMQIASRPALPDRELGPWIESILGAVGVK